MNTFYKKIEMFANIAIILVAVSLVVVLAKRFVFTGATNQPPATQQSSVGTKLAVPDVDWSSNNKTVVLVLSDTCRYCTASAPFYKRLVQEQAQRANFRLTAVLPQPVDDGRKYLNELGVSINEIKQLSAEAIGVRGTPTLLLVNNVGVVTDAWLGKLTPQEEAEVLSRLQ